ncbi:MAG TPA: DUF1501 domain-containing protein [Blastocatellia bacterium]|nr:DUF1501 domain-containing protein [Blastocatellia bacterium]
MSKSSRRGFLRNLILANERQIPDAGAKTLVCVFLRGGADTLNMVVPYGDDRYYAVRPTLAIAPPTESESADAAIRLDDFYSFHPKLRPLLPLYREGRLAIVQAVGSDNPTGSHFEAQDQMEHGEAYGETPGGGWLGRYLRSRAGAREREKGNRGAGGQGSVGGKSVSQTLSLSSTSSPLHPFTPASPHPFTLSPLSAVAIGPTIPESLRAAPAASAIYSLEEVQIKTPADDPRAIAQALSAMYGAEVGVLSQPGMVTLDLLKRVETLREKSYAAEPGVEYPAGNFGAGLREIARLIKANVGLEAACIDLGGWDTHFFQGTASGLQAEVIAELAQGLAAFDADLAAYRDRVTTLVMTEFGRRIYENGSLGTDHGRGFALLAIGGGIKGGQVHGEWPGLEVEESFAGPGGLKLLIDYRSVLAEVLTGAMGCRDIAAVFPAFAPRPVGLVTHKDGG